MDVQDEIELLQIEITKANAVIAKALRDRRALDKDSPLVADFNAAVSGRQAGAGCCRGQTAKAVRKQGR